MPHFQLSRWCISAQILQIGSIMKRVQLKNHASDSHALIQGRCLDVPIPSKFVRGVLFHASQLVKNLQSPFSKQSLRCWNTRWNVNRFITIVLLIASMHTIIIAINCHLKIGSLPRRKCGYACAQHCLPALLARGERSFHHSKQQNVPHLVVANSK